MDRNTKKDASAKNLIDGITDDKELVAEVAESIERRKTARRLSTLRVLKGISQAEVASELNCSQSRVSKLECSEDDKWSVEDMRSYAKAVGFNIHLGIIPVDMKPTDEVKALTFAIRNRMESLAELAQRDEEIAGGVSNFFYELFLNFGRIFTTVSDSIPARSDGRKHFECRMVSTSETIEPDVLELIGGDTTTL